MHLIRGLKATSKESGQTLVMLALSLPLMLLFVGFAIDFGLGFLAKAELAKGCDAANLEALLNYGLGQTQASAIGQSVFALNFSQDALFKNSPPTATFTFGTDPTSGSPICNCNATASIHTFFIRLMGIGALHVTDYSQATRPPVLLSLVLDRTGSMNGNGGAAALPGAVSTFINYFIENTDQVGQVSFAWTGTNDVPIAYTFISPINTSLSNMKFAEGTYSMSGLQSGLSQITSVTNPPPNALKYVVFFTDGWDNTIQASLTNPTTNKSVMVEFGGNAATASGFDEGDSLVFVDPNNIGLNSTNGFDGASALPSTTVTCKEPATGYPSDSSMQNCNGANTFIPLGGSSDPLGTSPVSINRVNITADAEYSTYQFAEQMRAQGITVYAIGMGSDINQTYLQELANDPASDKYNPNEPSGMAVFASASNLNFAFQTVAKKILLRLTQ